MGWIKDWIKRRGTPHAAPPSRPSDSADDMTNVERCLWRSVLATRESWPVCDGKRLAVHAYLASLDSRALVAFDQKMRSIYFPHDCVLPDDILDELTDASIDTRTAEAVRFVTSMHRSGFLRERALRELAQRPSRLTLAATLLRTTDWVDQVRNVAVDALAGVLDGCTDDDVFANLPLLMRLNGQTRADDAWLDDAFGSWLFHDESRLRRTLDASDAPVRRWAYRRTLAAGDAVADQHILDRAVRDADPAIVSWALGSLDATTDAHRRRLLEIGRRARHPMARQRALRMFVEHVEPLPPGLLHEALLDSSIGIRSFAAFVMRTRGLGDPADVWRVEADTEPMPISAVLSLAELSGLPDEARLRRALNHANSRARAAAARALQRMHAHLTDDEFLHLLTDDAPRVRNVLGKMCRAGDPLLSGALLARAWRAVPAKAGWALTQLLNALSPNDRFALLLAFEPSTPGEFAWWNTMLSEWADRTLGWWPLQANERCMLSDMLALRRPELDGALRTRFTDALAR